MTKLTLIAILLCLTGAFLSAALLDPGADGLVARVCRSGCAETVQSRWSSLSIPVPRPHRDGSITVGHLDVPVAFMGLAYFVCMGVWYGLADRRRLPLHAALCALPVSIALVGLMAAGAAPWCVACLAVHAINALLVLVAWRLAHTAPAEAAAGNYRQAVTAATVAMLMVGGLGLHYRAAAAHGRERAGLLRYKHLVTSLQQDPEFLLREHAAGPRYEFAARPTEETAGDHHQLVVFSDFACPACFCNAARIHDQIAKTFDGRLDVLVRHLPHGDTAPARAAEAARRLGGEPAFRQMYRGLFLQRDELGPELYESLAAMIGLDPGELLYEMNTPEVCETIEADMTLARQIGVDATPTMFLDGRRVTELCETPAFWDAVAAAGTNQPPLASAE